MTKFSAISKAQFFLFSLFASALTFAQDNAPDLKVDVTTDKGVTGGGDWMTNPLVWVIGALVLILIIALVARGGGNRA